MFNLFPTVLASVFFEQSDFTLYLFSDTRFVVFLGKSAKHEPQTLDDGIVEYEISSGRSSISIGSSRRGMDEYRSVKLSLQLVFVLMEDNTDELRDNLVVTLCMLSISE